MTRRELNRATLSRQGLLERQDVTPVRMAEQLCGLQAQEPLPPLVGLWTRVAHADREQLEGLVRDGKLVRATLMRGTLHLVSAADYRRLRPALQPVLDEILARHPYTKDLDLDAVEAAARSVFGHRTLTFDEVRERLASEFPQANPRGLGYAARLRLGLVAHADGFRVMQTGRAIPLTKLAERYLAAFGPASPADFRVWSGLRAEFAQPEAPRVDPDTPRPCASCPRSTTSCSRTGTARGSSPPSTRAR